MKPKRRSAYAAEACQEFPRATLPRMFHSWLAKLTFAGQPLTTLLIAIARDKKQLLLLLSHNRLTGNNAFCPLRVFHRLTNHLSYLQWTPLSAGLTRVTFHYDKSFNNNKIVLNSFTPFSFLILLHTRYEDNLPGTRLFHVLVRLFTKWLLIINCIS